LIGITCPIDRHSCSSGVSSGSLSGNAPPVKISKFGAWSSNEMAVESPISTASSTTLGIVGVGGAVGAGGDQLRP
jgi:hypothetical protein